MTREASHASLMTPTWTSTTRRTAAFPSRTVAIEDCLRVGAEHRQIVPGRHDRQQRRDRSRRSQTTNWGVRLCAVAARRQRRRNKCEAGVDLTVPRSTTGRNSRIRGGIAMDAQVEGRYGWVMVAVGALMSCVAIGAMFSLAVFLQPITESTGWSRAGVSSAMTLNFIAMGVAGFAWGALSDRFGARVVVLIGAVLLGAGLVLASRATSQIEFQLVYGVLVGVAAGSFFAPMIAAVSSWFERHR